MNKRILLVDDELEVLSGYQRNLRKHFVIQTALSGFEALDIIKEQEPFAVIITDFNMPKLNGIDLLTIVKSVRPDMVRMILTGYADLPTAIDAVNEGSIFRFLTKPISTDLFIQNINQAIRQYDLVNAEKVLLDKTLKGSIKVLIDILSSVKPAIFNKSNRIRKIAKRIGEQIAYQDMWALEISALLSQIGCVSIPQEILDKKLKNIEMTPQEIKIYNSHPEVGHKLLNNIPKLEKVAESIYFQMHDYKAADYTGVEQSAIPMIAKILRVAIDFDHFLETQGYDEAGAFTQLLMNSYIYAPAVLDALEKNIFGNNTKGIVKSVNFKSLRIGMNLADDMKDDKGNVLVRKGSEITDIILLRLINVSKVRVIADPIRIIEYNFGDE